MIRVAGGALTPPALSLCLSLSPLSPEGKILRRLLPRDSGKVPMEKL
jgi:hypothetical protein